MEKIFAGLGFIAAIVLGVAFGGYVLSVLWAWFIVTTFAVMPLGIAQAIGVSLTFGFLFRSRRPLEKDDAPLNSLLFMIAMPLAMLGIGWIVKQWL